MFCRVFLLLGEDIVGNQSSTWLCAIHQRSDASFPSTQCENAGKSVVDPSVRTIWKQRVLYGGRSITLKQSMPQPIFSRARETPIQQPPQLSVMRLRDALPDAILMRQPPEIFLLRPFYCRSAGSRHRPAFFWPSHMPSSRQRADRGGSRWSNLVRWGLHPLEKRRLEANVADHVRGRRRGSRHRNLREQPLQARFPPFPAAKGARASVRYRGYRACWMPGSIALGASDKGPEFRGADLLGRAAFNNSTGTVASDVDHGEAHCEGRVFAARLGPRLGEIALKESHIPHLVADAAAGLFSELLGEGVQHLRRDHRAEHFDIMGAPGGLDILKRLFERPVIAGAERDRRLRRVAACTAEPRPAGPVPANMPEPATAKLGEGPRNSRTRKRTRSTSSRICSRNPRKPPKPIVPPQNP